MVACNQHHDSLGLRDHLGQKTVELLNGCLGRRCSVKNVTRYHQGIGPLVHNCSKDLGENSFEVLLKGNAAKLPSKVKVCGVNELHHLSMQLLYI